MASFGAGSYLVVGEALGEGLFQAQRNNGVTGVQSNAIIYGVADRLNKENEGFRVEQFAEQVQAYIELAYHVANSQPDFEQT